MPLVQKPANRLPAGLGANYPTRFAAGFTLLAECFSASQGVCSQTISTATNITNVSRLSVFAQCVFLSAHHMAF